VIRVLVVDDSLLLRQFLCETLTRKPDFQAVGEASDGLEAVQKAEELQPDLILLDIGLPKLNGIETAKRVRQIAPATKILFLSLYRDADVVRAALSGGGLGYVLKAYARSELWPAIETVLQGKRFVSAGLAGHDLTDCEDEHATDNPRSKQVVDLHPPREAESSRRHAVAFYPDNASFLRGVGRFVETSLSRGSAVIVIATEAHRISLLSRLQSKGLDTATALEQGRYIALNAADGLSAYMVSGMPHPLRFLKLFGDLVARGTKAAKEERVAIFGECVHLLWAQGNAEAAIQVERLGNQLAKVYDVGILCGYSPKAVQGRMDADIFKRICAEHSAVYGLGY